MSPQRKDKGLLGTAFDQALARLSQADKKELEDLADKIRREIEEVERYAEERRDSIRRGARRAPKRFRL